jgi:2-iminobutanoate/2-iminopropanoate deaminase
MRLLLVGLLLLLSSAAEAQVRAVVSPQSRANRFYSPGVDAGDYVYVSGQGPRRPDGSLPASFADQCRQALDNVKSVVESAGLTTEHVVYTQVYLQDISKYGEMNRVFGEYFAKIPPARAVLGVARLPDPPIQISALWQCAVWETAGPSIRQTTAPASLPRRASSRTTACSSPGC